MKNIIEVSREDIIVEMPNGQNGQSMNPAGEWSSEESYGFLDIVTSNGSSYVALKFVPAGTALTDTEYWQMIAAKGDFGITVGYENGYLSIS